MPDAIIAADPKLATSHADSNQILWLALTLTPGLGPTRSRRLVEFFGTIDRVFAASLTELEAAGLPAQSAQALGTGRSVQLANEEIARATAADVRLVAFDDPAYPARLRQIYDPPLMLYVRGSVAALSLPGVAVVGTRHPTPYGTGMAERLACDLAARGLVIFSGLARGVDTAAHRGAVAGKGKTVAMFGTGVDVLYPKENSRLSEQILASGGALVSEFPLGNRIISGISLGVLVVEAAEYSGTRITARCALEQGRDVYAVPGNVTNKNSWGPNTLIKQGAKLVATWEDVWEELPQDVRLALTPETGAESPGSQTESLFEEPSLSPHEKKIYSVLKADEAMHLDEIIEALEPNLSSSEIFAALFDLELAGKVKQLPGKNFVKSFSCQLSAISSQLSAFSKPIGRERCRAFGILRSGKRHMRWTLDIYTVSRSFPKDELYGLTSQMRRASASVGANIAEGSCRKGDIEFARFLQIAMGSASELEYHLFLARDLRILQQLDYERLAGEVVEVKRMLASLIRSVREIKLTADS